MEKLCRLNPKTQSYTDSGGRADLSPADIAAGCAGANPMGLAILLARVCDDRSNQEALFYRLYSKVIDMAVSQNWRTGKRGDDRIRSVLQLAMFEKVFPRPCPSCNGTKFKLSAPAEGCAPCNGTGKWLLEDRDRAAAVGISSAAWCKTWRDRYADICYFLECQEYEAVRSISEKLIDKAERWGV